MTSKQRLMAAIRHEEVDYVPCSPRIWAWLKEYYGNSDWKTHLHAAKEFDFDPTIIISSGIPNYFTATDDSVDGLSDVEIKIEVRDDKNSNIIIRNINTPAGPLREVIRVPKPGHIEYGISPNPMRLEHLVKDSSDLEKLKYLFPDPKKCNILKEYEQIEREVGEDGIVEVTINSPLDYHAEEAYGLENIMIDYYERRDFIEKLINLFHKNMMTETKAVLEKGVKIIFGSWFLCSMSVGWSPSIYQELFAPLLKEHVDLVHSYGAIYNFYDDGKCMKIIDTLKKCGIDIIETLTPPPVGDIDLAEVKRRIGKQVCLKGYIDLLYVIKMGTPDLIKNKVKEAIEIAAPGSGFILGTSDSIRDGTPLKNVRAYFNAARKYGRR